MRTFYSSPFSSKAESAEFRELCTVVHSVLNSRQPEDIPQMLWSMLREIFGCNLVLWTAGQGSPIQNGCQVYPPIGGKAYLPLVLTQEQGAAIVKQNAAMIIRIIDQHDSQLISLMLKESAATWARDVFSVLYLRQTIGENTAYMVGFVATKKNAFTDTHVACLFKLAGIFTEYWEKAAPRHLDAKNAGENAYLPLADLPGMQGVLDAVLKISRFDFPVLLLGETGTGKEGVATSLYNSSLRYGKPFIKINCGSIPASLVESRLFGHEKGAFTSASSTVKGCFERADSGILFMDEVAELSLAAQTDILRAIQENIIERVGGSTEIPVDIRIIAATNKNLPLMVKQGLFREDLFYRLSVFPIVIPPLRQRQEDILCLAEFFVQQICHKMGQWDLPVISKANKAILTAYHWPGNIRELMNVVIRAVLSWIAEPGKDFAILPKQNPLAGLCTTEQDVFALHTSEFAPVQGIAPSNEDLTLETAIKRHIQHVLEVSKGKVSGYHSAAELLGLPSGTLRAKMKKYGISPHSSTVIET